MQNEYDNARAIYDNLNKNANPRRQNRQKSPSERKFAYEVVFQASVEIRASILNATIIIVAFLLLFFLSGMEGRVLKPLGIAFTVEQPLGHGIDHMLSGTRTNIAIKLFGPDLNRLFMTGNEIKAAIVDIEGLVDVNVDQQIEIPQIQISANHDLLAQYGISLEQFNEFVNISFGGEKLADIYEGQLLLMERSYNRAVAELRQYE